MEVYIGPGQAAPDRVLHRDEVLAALKRESVVVARTEEKPATGSLRARWILSFDGSEVSLQFQETDDGLVFATLDQSMFDRSDLPDQVCHALESLGWAVDQESVG